MLLVAEENNGCRVGGKKVDYCQLEEIEVLHFVDLYPTVAVALGVVKGMEVGFFKKVFEVEKVVGFFVFGIEFATIFINDGIIDFYAKDVQIKREAVEGGLKVIKVQRPCAKKRVRRFNFPIEDGDGVRSIQIIAEFIEKRIHALSGFCF